jgi:hypothetical protein
VTDEDETADDVFAPPAVTFDLSRERINEMARALVPLLDTQEARLLAPRLRREHQVVVDQIDALKWDDPARAVEQAIELLKKATSPDGLIDPADDHGDVAWCRMLTRLGDAPVAGSRAARQWFTHLFRLRTEDIVVSTMTEAVAAYAVAAFEYRRRRHHEVERWSLTAAIQTDFDEPGTRGAVAYVRAARLLEGVLPQRRPGSGP